MTTAATLSTTTFSSIGFTFFGGLLVLLLCLLLFGMALRYQSPCIAPRATARPRTVIYNRHARLESPQYRGHAVLGWIPWTLSLSYDTLLRGVPGTGTRQAGLAGRLLQTNLDGIVLLRFHAIGRRVAAVATILCVGVLLPLYVTSPTIDCNDIARDGEGLHIHVNITSGQQRRRRSMMMMMPQRQDFVSHSLSAATSSRRAFFTHRNDNDSDSTSLITDNDEDYDYGDDEYHGMQHLWNDPCHAYQTLTDYGKTTLAHVPIMIQESYIVDPQNVFLLNYRLMAIAVRLYAVVVVLWIITLHVLYLLKQEWIDLLALRRVYYLESNVYKERLKEGWAKNCNKTLEQGNGKQTTINSAHNGIKEHRTQQIHRRGARANASNGDLTPPRSKSQHSASAYSTDEEEQFDDDDGDAEEDDESQFHISLLGMLDDNDEDDHAEEEERLMNDREPWIPHPEQPDTVAHVGLYSLLVGNLPTLPEANVVHDGQPDSHTFSNPIYSHLSSKRDGIDWQLSMTSAFFDNCVPNQPGFSSSVAAVSILPGAADITVSWQKWYAAAARLRRLRFIRKQIERRKQQHILRRRMSMSDRGLSASERGGPSEQSHRPDDMSSMRTISEVDIDSAVEMVDLAPTKNELQERDSFLEQKKKELRHVLGPIVADDADNKVYESFSFGPEQMAIYGREFAQAASPCCPNGFCEQWVTRANLEELLDMEEEAAIQLHQTICELQDVRCHVSAVAVDERGVPLNETPTASPSPRSKKGYYKTLSKDPDRPDLSRSNSQLETDLLEASGNSSRWKKTASKWEVLESVVEEARDNEYMHARTLPNGIWSWPTCTGLLSFPCLKDWRKHFQTESAVQSLARESSFAVVTFTSRQAAIAARHCLSDGRAFGRWSNMQEIPIAPLSDAAPCNLLLCRNFCRPVTLSISDSQKTIRFYLTLLFLACLYVFYTIPLTFASSLVNPEVFEELFPFLAGTDLPHVITGFLSAMIWSIFFMICPQLFRTIANVGSVAISVAKAERRALQYFWWFMVFTAFTGPILAQWVLNAIDNDFQFGAGLREALRLIAGATATVVSANWLNWIIYRFTIIIPLHYMLQFNTFFLKFLGLKCFSRLTIGGGPGGPIPYRIFVDSGVVIMCTVALAPVCPVVAPAALLYFFICEPILRRNLIFVYRPRYDDGGLRWTFLFDMIISGLVMAQILLSVQMTLKNAYGPMLITACAVPVTVFFSYYCKNKYSVAFHDAALLQTALLDGWDKSSEMSMDEREQYRRFLVDAHKAAYIPVCIAGADTGDYLTAEPAIVIPRGMAEETEDLAQLSPVPPPPPLTPTQLDNSNQPLRTRTFSSDTPHDPLRQPGVTLRRADSGVAAWLEGQDRDVEEGVFDGNVPEMDLPEVIDDFLSAKKKLK